MIYDVIIIGGGAAGLMCQYHLAGLQIHTLLIEKNARLGKKLLLTGNGRCNVTNHFTPQEFIEHINGAQKKFFYKAIHAFSTEDIVSFFTANDVDLRLENGFQYFPKSNSSKDILDVLTKTTKNITVQYEETVTAIKQEGSLYHVLTNKHQYLTKKLVIATGSNSYPKTGSSGDGIVFAKNLGIAMIPFYPAETKVYASLVEKLSLQGLQIPNAKVSLLQSKHQFKGDLLFTHNGLSGPVIYHLSEEIYHMIQTKKKAVLSIDLLNITRQSFVSILHKTPAKTLEKVFATLTSKRLASTLFGTYELPKKPIQELQQETYDWVFDFLTDFQIEIEHVEDITKAYVNGGGIKTKELNPSTMESKKYPGLYFIGETIDLHGPIGGFNITIAFSTAFLAAKHIKEDLYA